MMHDLTPVHLAAVSVASALGAAVSFAVDGPTIVALVTATVTMGGALAKLWRSSVSAAAEVQVLRMQVAEQAKQITEQSKQIEEQSRQIDVLTKLLNSQADLIAESAE